LDPERANKLESDAMTLEEKARKLQDEGVFDGLRAFRMGDADGMKAALSKSGQFQLEGDVTLTPVDREIPGLGKITTYNATFTAVGPDGKKTPRTVNSHDLSVQMMPFEKAIKAQMDARETDAKVRETEAKAGYYNSAAGAKDATAAGGTGKALKLDEDDKLRLTTANTRVRDAEKALGEALSKMMTGDDPNQNPGVVYAKGLLKAAKADHLRANIELGQIQPKSMATQILSVSKDPQGVLASLSDLQSLSGPEFSDQVAAEIQESDVWKAMNAKKGAPAAGGKPAAAAGMGGPPAPKQTEMKPAPEVTSAGLPRDPNARATKFRSKPAAATQGIPVPREQATKEAAAAAATAKNAADAYRVADMPGFQYLPTEEQIRIANLAKGQ
jgi:hypothetical protein